MPHYHDAIAPTMKAEVQRRLIPACEAGVRVKHEDAISIADHTKRIQEEPNRDRAAFVLAASPRQNWIIGPQVGCSRFGLIDAMRTVGINECLKSARPGKQEGIGREAVRYECHCQAPHQSCRLVE